MPNKRQFLIPAGPGVVAPGAGVVAPGAGVVAPGNNVNYLVVVYSYTDQNIFLIQTFFRLKKKFDIFL